MMIEIKKDNTCGSSVLEISGNNMLTKIMFKGGLPVQKISCEKSQQNIRVAVHW